MTVVLSVILKLTGHQRYCTICAI